MEISKLSFTTNVLIVIVFFSMGILPQIVRWANNLRFIKNLRKEVSKNGFIKLGCFDTILMPNGSIRKSIDIYINEYCLILIVKNLIIGARYTEQYSSILINDGIQNFKVKQNSINAVTFSYSKNGVDNNKFSFYKNYQFFTKEKQNLFNTLNNWINQNLVVKESLKITN